MNKQVKELWLTALRSGEYKQAQEYLKKDDGFCCLGVLCDLHSRATGIKWDGGYYLNVSCILPDEVVAWAGLDSFIPTVSFNGLDKGLPHFNDHLNFNFNQIADLIEEEL